MRYSHCTGANTIPVKAGVVLYLCCTYAALVLFLCCSNHRVVVRSYRHWYRTAAERIFLAYWCWCWTSTALVSATILVLCCWFSTGPELVPYLRCSGSMPRKGHRNSPGCGAWAAWIACGWATQGQCGGTRGATQGRRSGNATATQGQRRDSAWTAQRVQTMPRARSCRGLRSRRRVRQSSCLCLRGRRSPGRLGRGRSGPGTPRNPRGTARRRPSAGPAMGSCSPSPQDLMSMPSSLPERVPCAVSERRPMCTQMRPHPVGSDRPIPGRIRTEPQIGRFRSESGRV